MALTLKGRRVVRQEPYKEILVDVAWDSSYADGGETIAAADVGLSVIDRIDDSLHASSASGYLCRWNGSALVLYQGDARTGETTLTDSTTGTASATLAAGVGMYTLSHYINLASITTAADVLTTFTIPHKFKILAFDAFVVIPATTADKLLTLNLEIGTTNLTGGAIALTSANCTPLGAKIAGSSITAANTGAAAAIVSIEAASVTAFAEGAVMVQIQIQNMDTADAFASLAANNAILAGLLDDNGTLAPVAAETDLATTPVTGTIRIYGR